jgi:hypothetical protein
MRIDLENNSLTFMNLRSEGALVSNFSYFFEKGVPVHGARCILLSWLCGL